jgi:hypothetical protein
MWSRMIETKLYYDVTTGLKSWLSNYGTSTIQSVTKPIIPYGDSRAVKGVKVPYNGIQNVGIELDI